MIQRNEIYNWFKEYNSGREFMDIHTIRQQLRSRSIYDIPLRVTYYARVSSESDEQLNSLGNQIQ